MIYFFISGEITRLVQEKEGDLEKYEHSREELQKRLAQLERDMQMALTQEKQAHEDDVDRMSREKVKHLSLDLSDIFVHF